jgi:signal peptidase
MHILDYKIKHFFPLIDELLKVIFFVLLPLAVFTLLTSRVSLFGMQSFIVLTGSMEPTLPVGSVVYTIKQHEYSIRDIITFKTPDNVFISHRIVGFKNTQFKTKGDANNVTDANVVNKSQVVGKAITVIPLLGYAIAFLKTIPGFLALIVLPTILYIGFELRVIKEEIEKEVTRKLTGRVHLT